MAKKVLTILSILMFSAAATAFAGSYGKSADIVDTAVSAGDFNTLVTAVKAAELVDTLKGERPFYRVCADRRGFRQTAARYG